MKSSIKLDWTLAGFLAAQYGLEFLENRTPQAAACLRHFSYPALVKARLQMQDKFAVGGLGEFFHETSAVDTELISVTGNAGVVEVRGCLILNRRRDGIHFDTILTSVFRLRLTCLCHPNPESPDNLVLESSQKRLTLPNGVHALRRWVQNCVAPFQLQITDFDYETIY
jgi:hypothetical protein